MTKDIQKTSGSKLIATMAAKYGLDPNVFFSTLKATILKPVKSKDGSMREATNEELAAFLVVANKYNLDPFTKEIYGFMDKSGGIVPVVSTDGWNRLMTSNETYKAHEYLMAPLDDWGTPNKGKLCPPWMEIQISKKDGGVVRVREYLDECFRELSYQNPWQSHTKRMLRHKTKIQGAREAFGFSGIYDEDEAARIIEAKAVESIPDKQLEMPKPKEEVVKEKEEEIEYASEKHVENLKKIAAQAKITDADLIDMISATGDEPDHLTLKGYQTVMRKVMESMDARTKAKQHEI